MAYCTSIHKAQGSEFKMVILPIVHQYSRMLQRNLLYTAVTRASDFLIMLGEQDAFEQCVRSVSVNRRTSLVKRLVDAVGRPTNHPVVTDELNKPLDGEQEQAKADAPAEPDRLTISVINNNEIDPMIGMGSTSPKDFM